MQQELAQTHANHIKNLRIKQNFRRKRGGQTCQRTWDNNKGIHQKLLRPLNRSNKNSWNLTKLTMALTKYTITQIPN